MMNLHSPTVSIMHAILYTVIDSLLGEKKENWSEKFRPEDTADRADYDDCTVDIFRQRYPQAESLESSAKIPPSNFVGTYFAPGYGQLEIYIRGKRPLPLFPSIQTASSALLGKPVPRRRILSGLPDVASSGNLHLRSAGESRMRAGSFRTADRRHFLPECVISSFTRDGSRRPVF